MISFYITNINELSFSTAQQGLTLISLLSNKVGCKWKEPWRKATAKGGGQQDQYSERCPGQLSIPDSGTGSNGAVVVPLAPGLIPSAENLGSLWRRLVGGIMTC